MNTIPKGPFWPFLTALAVALSSCGGGSGGSGPFLPGPGTSPASGQESSTVPVTAENPVASFDPVGTLDFSSEPGILGKSVRLERRSDPAADLEIGSRTGALAVSLPDSSTIIVAAPTRPGSSLPAKLKVRGTHPPDGQGWLVYGILLNKAGDDVGGVDTLDSTYFGDDSTVEVLIQPYFFIEEGGEFVARLKVALATTMPEDVIKKNEQSSAKTSNQTFKPSINAIPDNYLVACPFGQGHGCTELSQLNPSRYLGGVPKPHDGTDFRAALGTPVYAPPSYMVDVGGLTPSSWKGEGQGISIVMSGGEDLPRLFFQHLQDLEKMFIDPNNPAATNKNRAPAEKDTILGWSGDTGAAGNPHLHLETYLYKAKGCEKRALDGVKCRLGLKASDTFQQMIKSFEIELPQEGSLPLGAAQVFTVKAYDKAGSPLSSDVGMPNESEYGDPTRKLCYADSAGIMHWEAPGRLWLDSAGGLNMTCVPWGDAIRGAIMSPGGTEVQIRYSTWAASIYGSIGSLVATAFYWTGGCPAPADPNAVRLPRICRHDFAMIKPGESRPLDYFFTIDPGNDPQVTWVGMGISFFKGEASNVTLSGATPTTGDTTWNGRPVAPNYSFTVSGSDIFYSCQGLAQPHPASPQGVQVLLATSNAQAAAIPVLVVQYQRLNQAGASCMSGGYMPFTRSNIYDAAYPLTVDLSNPVTVAPAKP